ncbi:hypothetical protein BKK79_01950 [Cupriavidus sp. USMAA2-4]|uniref:hypothetical protein n=1 Tax=Cupriavidus sp. USMAA2-4 TaxID=876364 RepID=UPI0008A6AC20|nr:hypothetical protein [Cupriavidus sp. USMAA2-4]AOY90715.1 hypothetical protein BKK79_01950 [Cupriavidus sp. USMAA2-4]
MSARTPRLATTLLLSALSLAMSDCKWHPSGPRTHEAVDMEQVPAPVRAAIERQAGARSVGEIEKQTANGRTRHEVTLGSSAGRATILIDEDGRQVAAAAED